jgi:hypothetical protein
MIKIKLDVELCETVILSDMGQIYEVPEKLMHRYNKCINEYNDIQSKLYEIVMGDIHKGKENEW